MLHGDILYVICIFIKSYKRLERANGRRKLCVVWLCSQQVHEVDNTVQKDVNFVWSSKNFLLSIINSCLDEQTDSLI